MEEEKKKLALIVTVLHGDCILSTKAKIMNDELLGLREGPFTLEHQLADLGAKVVKEAFETAAKNA
jgi:hypothetical protein